MKTRILAVAAASFSVPLVALADGHAPPAGAGAGPQGGPPPAVVSQMSLGQAGLLDSFYSDAQFGTTRGRRGEDNTRLGFSAASGLTSGFAHSANQLVASLTGRTLLPDGSSYLTFGIGINETSEDPNLTQFDTSIPGITIGYQNFLRPDLAYAAYLGYTSRETTDGTVTTGRDEISLRFDAAKKLSDQWGVTGRLFFGSGDLEVTTPGGTTVEPETVLYSQAELVGNFASVGPNGWVANPIFGVSYDINTVDSGGGDDSETAGSVWAKARLSQPARPGSWSPNVTLGLEHVYENSTDAFLDEDTYAILGLGAQYMSKKGNLFNAAFERRQGFNGNREKNVFVVGYTYNF